MSVRRQGLAPGPILAAFLACLLAAGAAATPSPVPPADAGRAGSGAQEVGPPAPGALARAAELAHHPDDEMRRLANRALELLNDARAAADLPPLAHDPGLAILARRHALELARRRRVTHHSELFDLTTERRVKISFPWLARFGENVARNGTVELLHESLLRSPGHRGSRMDPDFTHAGIGVARQSPHMLYMVELFADARDARSLEAPATFYFEASPGAYEPRDAPRSELTGETLTIGARGAEDPEYWTTRGIDAFEKGDLETARTRFRRALELADDYQYARYNLSRVLLQLERPAEAAEELDLLLEVRPEDIEARYARGTAALLLGDYARAEAEFRRVVQERRRDAGAWYNLGLALEYQDRPDDAAGAYLTALDIDPTMVEARRALRRIGREPGGRPPGSDDHERPSSTILPASPTSLFLALDRKRSRPRRDAGRPTHVPDSSGSHHGLLNWDAPWAFEKNSWKS